MSSTPADAYVGVAADGSGKKIAVQEITRADNTTVVEVQEVLDRAVVNDTPLSALQVGDLVPLSMTMDGRLRVSSLPAAFVVPMLDDEEGAMWGGIRAFARGGW